MRPRRHRERAHTSSSDELFGFRGQIRGYPGKHPGLQKDPPIYTTSLGIIGSVAMNIRKVRSIGVVVLCVTLASTGTASELEATCRGNIESFDKKIIQAGVTYLLRYEISDAKAKIKFAGREFDAVVERGTSWKGHWIKKIEDEEYFSFLPNDGGTIKFQFEPNRWFSGNC